MDPTHEAYPRTDFQTDLGQRPMQSSEYRVGPFECATCHVVFQCQQELETHLQRFGIYTCDICREEFDEKGYLRHLLRLHADDEKKFQCHTCSKEFTSQCDLKRHFRTHPGEKKFRCRVCAREFNDNSNLKRHMWLHVAEKPFPCSECMKEFTDPSSLTRHMRIHTGEKPFPCTVCGKKFNTKSGATIHARIHTGEKPFPCNVCGKKFREKSTVKRHMLTHAADERPY